MSAVSMGTPEGCGVYEMLEMPARGTENGEKGTETERRIAGQRERQKQSEGQKDTERGREPDVGRERKRGREGRQEPGR